MADQIDAARIVLRTLRWLDDGRRKLDESWRAFTGREDKPAAAPADRREPPEIW
mgnify:CR=1 FL=1